MIDIRANVLYEIFDGGGFTLLHCWRLIRFPRCGP